MAPRAFTNPAPKTESAREARKSFFCELCQKGYSRMNEFEAHESSYDHQHKKRLKEMKQMQRDPLASSKARKAERKADEKSGLITIKPVKLESQPPSSMKASGSTAAGSGGFKKGGFKSAFAPANDDEVLPKTSSSMSTEAGFKKAFPESDVSKAEQAMLPEESDTEDEGYEMYDPTCPTE